MPGNISQVNLTTNSTTNRWQAFIGNITGFRVLGDSGGLSIYEWTAANPTGEVYLTTYTGVPNFASLTNLTLFDRDAMDSAGNWSFGTGDDQINDTYTLTRTFSVGGSTLQTFAVTTTSPFTTGVLNNTGADCPLGCRSRYMFVTNISADTASYSGALADYEIMVPAVSTDNWYFYVELD